MSDALRRLETETESAFHLVDFGRDPVPGAACMARVHRAVDDESRRLARTGTWQRTTFRSFAAAAAILVAIGASWFADAPTADAPAADPMERLAVWDEAISRSSTVMTRLLDASAVPEAQSEAEAELGIDDFSRAFDTNLGAGA